MTEAAATVEPAAAEATMATAKSATTVAAKGQSSAGNRSCAYSDRENRRARD